MSTTTQTTGMGRRVGERGGAIAGQVAGGVLGSLFGPVGTLVGRAIGAKAGQFVGGIAGEAVEDYIASRTEEADEKAEAEERASTASPAQEVCGNCQPRCRELEELMKQEMYANKRGPGGSGKHGLALRRAEQICGAYGPGMTKMEPRRLRDGTQRIRQTQPWSTHWNEIDQQQTRLRAFRDEYKSLNCDRNDDKRVNMNEIDRMTANDFNPTAGEWLGPNHPSCAGLHDLIHENTTPELPTFPRPPRGSIGSAGVPTS